MKTPRPLLCLLPFLCAAPLADAATYKGSWNNKTFGSKGDLTIDFNVTKTRISGKFDADGPVFGAGDPPAIPFSAAVKPDGTGRFRVLGTNMGDITGDFDTKGKFVMKITNIPGGQLTEVRFNGRFDLGIESFRGTYEIDSQAGLFAEGTTRAHVRKAAVLKGPKTVKVKGKKARINVRATSYTRITKVRVVSNPKVKVRVAGKGPYRLLVSNLKPGTTRLTVRVRNADGLWATKKIRVIRRANAADALVE